jgi:hypothetical protein
MEAHTSVCESRVCDKKMVAGFERGCDWEGHYLNLPSLGWIGELSWVGAKPS